MVPNTDRDQVNLEHVVGQKANSADWPTFSVSEFEDMKYRLGNLVLLRKSVNNQLGNGDFGSKKDALAASILTLTKAVGELDDWTPAAITKRQDDLAELAVRVWPRRV